MGKRKYIKKEEIYIDNHLYIRSLMDNERLNFCLLKLKNSHLQLIDHYLYWNETLKKWNNILVQCNANLTFNCKKQFFIRLYDPTPITCFNCSVIDPQKIIKIKNINMNKSEEQKTAIKEKIKQTYINNPNIGKEKGQKLIQTLKNNPNITKNRIIALKQTLEDHKEINIQRGKKISQTRQNNGSVWDSESVTQWFLNNPQYFISNVKVIQNNNRYWDFYDIDYGWFSADYSNIMHRGDLHPQRNKSIGGDILSHLLPEGIIYNNKKLLNSECKYKPDYISKSHKLIIEADGLYWHSAKRDGNILGNKYGQVDKHYHFNKFKEYTKLGYKFLSFNDWEIENKPEIVRSIIYNKMNLNNIRIYARKCTLIKLNTKESNIFFEENHLMGKGSGNTIALKYNNEIVCVLRYVNKEKEVHISRFACKNFTSVIGGYSKLLKQLDVFEKDIINFVDCRHGTGEHLLSKGFELVKESIGFWWTNGKEIYNRRKYLGSSGLEKGFERYWDYGQRKYVKKFKT